MKCSSDVFSKIFKLRQHFARIGMFYDLKKSIVEEIFNDYNYINHTNLEFQKVLDASY
jgi:hypothetical protein